MISIFWNFNSIKLKLFKNLLCTAIINFLAETFLLLNLRSINEALQDWNSWFLKCLRQKLITILLESIFTVLFVRYFLNAIASNFISDWSKRSKNWLSCRKPKWKKKKFWILQKIVSCNYFGNGFANASGPALDLSMEHSIIRKKLEVQADFSNIFFRLCFSFQLTLSILDVKNLSTYEYSNFFIHVVIHSIFVYNAGLPMTC